MGAVAEPKARAIRRSVVALAAAALWAGCGRAPDPPGSGAPRVTRTAAAPMPPEMQKIQNELDVLADQTRLEQEQDKRDRAELVTAAPPGFRPKAKGRKLELALIPQKKMLRVGETFWYRAEIRNVGSEPVTISDSFIKSGYDYYGAKFKIIVTPRHWKDHSVLGSAIPCEAAGLPIPGWDKMDKAQQAAASKRYRMEEKLKHRVRMRLEPGEIVRTRDERYVSREEDCAAFQAGKVASNRPGGLFRQYFETRDFDKPGTYTLRLTLSDPPIPMSPESRSNLERNGFSAAEISRHEEALKAIPLGKAESPAVTIEVVR
jgi:hypothetical protein